jgi:hypothetical protein
MTENLAFNSNMFCRIEYWHCLDVRCRTQAYMNRKRNKRIRQEIKDSVRTVGTCGVSACERAQKYENKCRN